MKVQTPCMSIKKEKKGIPTGRSTTTKPSLEHKREISYKIKMKLASNTNQRRYTIKHKSVFAKYKTQFIESQQKK